MPGTHWPQGHSIPITTIQSGIKQDIIFRTYLLATNRAAGELQGGSNNLKTAIQFSNKIFLNRKKKVTLQLLTVLSGASHIISIIRWHSYLTDDNHSLIYKIQSCLKNWNNCIHAAFVHHANGLWATSYVDICWRTDCPTTARFTNYYYCLCICPWYTSDKAWLCLKAQAIVQT